MKGELSPRETEAVMHLMQGTQMKTAAVMMNCKERTVRFHLVNAKQKLKAKTLAHLVAKFIGANQAGRAV